MLFESAVDDDTLAKSWALLGDTYITHFYNFLGSNNSLQSLNKIYASIFAFIATLGKSEFNERWVKTRGLRYERDGSNYNIQALISDTILNIYVDLLKQRITDNQKFYGTLYTVMSLADRYELTSMKWIVEQASAAIIASILIFEIIKFFRKII